VTLCSHGAILNNFIDTKNQTSLALEILGLNKTYGDLTALDNINLKIKKGSMLGLLGPNGAGKSSIIKIITGSCIRNSGTVKIFSKDIEKDYLYTRKKIGVVPQEIISDGYFTVEEIMSFQSGFFDVPANKDTEIKILKKLDLYEHKNKRVEHLSGGMKRRLLVAKALVHNPEFLILDEPTAGVDVKLRYSLWKYIKEINNMGTTILLTTHYIEEAESLCNEIAIINKGKIIVSDTLENIKSKFGKNYSLEKIFVKLTGL
jgi:ABC-2 type transport system ATP-binding protein